MTGLCLFCYAPLYISTEMDATLRAYHGKEAEPVTMDNWGATMDTLPPFLPDTITTDKESPSADPVFR